MTAGACVVAARRTAITPTGGRLRSVAPHLLGAAAAKACLEDAGIAPECVDEIIVGNCLGNGGNTARLVALASGLPETVAGLTIDRQCCSGLDALLIAKALIESGQAEIVLAGGVESSSLRPACFRATDSGYADRPIDQAPFTPWPDRDPGMNEAADRLAREFGISRTDQDAWAVESHRKALAAEPLLARERAPVVGGHADRDDFSRRLSLAICRRAPVVTGSVTAANMSVAADGAALCAIVSGAAAHRRGRRHVQLLHGVTIGGNPELPGIAPVGAIRQVLGKAALEPGDLAVAELMEAYAAQAIACVQETGLDPEIVNPGGGSLARGHPVGASGAVLAVRLFRELQCGKGPLGLAAIAAAGGLGTALLFKTHG